MNIMRTLIIDDERLARKELIKILSEFPQINVIEECANGLEGVEKIHKLKPELVFLDIQMRGMSGFEMLENLNFL